MTNTPQKFEIRATYNAQEIAVYAAFSPSIADVAVQNQQFLPPFSYSRMTWIKPSYLWMMYRSDWARRAGQERILRIWLRREDWETILSEAVLSTPEKHVYPDAKKWRKQLEKSRVRVQWDPERDIRNQRLDYRSIQVGISAALSETYAKKWVQKIEDCTELTRQIRILVEQRRFDEAEQLLPEISIYPVSESIRKVLGMP